MEYYVYVWRDNAGTPFYVGKGKGNRAYEFRHRSPEFKEIHGQGGCTAEIVDWFIHESQAHAHEVELIERYGRREYGGVLINKTDGGEGASGRILSDTHKARIGASNSGRTASELARTKMSIAHQGKSLAPEHRAKIAAAHTGMIRSAEARARMSAAQVGRRHSAEALAKMRAAKAGRKLSDEHRAKISLGLRMSDRYAGGAVA